MTDSPGRWDPETAELIAEAAEEEAARLVQESQAAEAARQPASLREMAERSRGELDARREQMADRIFPGRTK